MKPHAGKVADGFRYAFRKHDPMQANQRVGWLDRRSFRRGVFSGKRAKIKPFGGPEWLRSGENRER